MSWYKSTPESEAMLAEERLVLAATEAVSEAMALAGKNKRDLAELVGVRPSEISQRLSGRRNLTLRNVAKMLHVLGWQAQLTLAPASPGQVEGPAVAVRPGNVINVIFKVDEPDSRFIGGREEASPPNPFYGFREPAAAVQ